MKKLQLKPCPFCGSSAEIIQTAYSHSNNGMTMSHMFVARCTHGCCETKKYSDEIIRSVDGLEIKHDGVLEAAEAWNRRATDDE